MPAVFISGTDTDCGKTHVATALLHALRGRGLSAVGYKPVAAGCEGPPTQLRNADALQLLAASDPGFAYEEINPVALAPAIAPHLALIEAKRRARVADLVEQGRRLGQRCDWLVVEGAGGFLVPLNAQESLADLPVQAGWPVILVVGMRLGCLNHALLSAEVIARRGRLLGWIANVLPPQQDRLEANLQTLQEMLPVPCFGVVRAADPLAAARELALDVLLDEAQKNL